MEAATNLPQAGDTDTGTPEEAAAVTGAVAAGSYEVVEIASLHIDEHYQRDLSRDLVEKIKRTWDATAAGAIVVSRRVNGDLYIVNGQHRTAAATELGHTEILAQVVQGLDRRGEALLRLMGNTRRTDTAQERFRAQIASGNRESIAIQQIAEQFGTKVNFAPDNKSGINTVAAVEDLYRMDNQGLMLTAVFEVIRDAFGAISGPVASVSMLKSTAWFLLKHRSEIDRQRFIERLAQAGLDAIDRKARSHKAVSGGALWTNYYRAMVESYNVRLTQATALEVRTGGWRGGELVRGWSDSNN